MSSQSAEEIDLPLIKWATVGNLGVLRRGLMPIHYRIGRACADSANKPKAAWLPQTRPLLFGVISPAVPGLVRFWCWVYRRHYD